MRFEIDLMFWDKGILICCDVFLRVCEVWCCDVERLKWLVIIVKFFWLWNVVFVFGIVMSEWFILNVNVGVVFVLFFDLGGDFF